MHVMASRIRSLEHPTALLRQRVSSATAALLISVTPLAFAQQPAETLDASLDKVAPGIPKWAVVCLETKTADGKLAFTWHDYRSTADKKDFWPASTIKLFAAIAALERVNEKSFGLDTVAIFEHQQEDGTWSLDASRTVREMISEIFRRSSNEDYTFLLRLAGLDWINTRLLVKERGFPGSAIMRGYSKDRPWAYVREERQRVRLLATESGRQDVIEHVWSGRSYSRERGCTILDPETGNVTTPRELAECLRKLLYHEQLPEAERFRLSVDQVQFLREGGHGLFGLAALTPESGPSAWKGLSWVFPKARFMHKSGVISNFALDLAWVDDSLNGGPRFILVPIVAAGHSTRPTDGETLVSQMALEIARWVRRSGESSRHPR